MWRRVFLITMLFLALLFLTAETAAMPPDGQYLIQVTLLGGSGRASVDSPTEILVSDDTVTATITWSSPYYEYMVVDGSYYYPVHTEGNTVFEIPVVLDTQMPVSAQTIAMSAPHLIDYSLFFDSATIKPLSCHEYKIAFIIITIIMAALLLRIVLSGDLKENKKMATGGKL